MTAKRKDCSPEKMIRPIVRRLNAYIPGEQPKAHDLIKLNTNENPSPPSPKAIQAIRNAADGRLRLYPDPTCQALRAKLASFHDCRPENIIIGNGSDELLALATRAFVEPRQPSATSQQQLAKQTVQYFTPSYSLYPILANIQGARRNEVKLLSNFDLPDNEELRKKNWNLKAALTFITTPNAPSGRGYTTQQLAKLCAAQKGVTILDEAYADFASENALSLFKQNPHVIISRTFSKSYSLGFQRIGYFIGHPILIAALDRIRDSYNVNGLGQTAAIAALKDTNYYRKLFESIKSTRTSTTAELKSLGFDVIQSQTNFVFAKPPRLTAKDWFDSLRNDKILTRWFDTPLVREYLRITIGSQNDMAKFIAATRRIFRR
tara:strand:- start:137 stop:1267 length:1131 start_codon:yes stop_codon:yes gene_type:complete